MSQTKFINIVSSLTVGILFFAFSLSSLTDPTGKNISTSDLSRIVFQAASDTETISENHVRGKGFFKLGEFALLQLNTESSELKLDKVEFDTFTKTLKEASGEVIQGSVLASNLLFGPRLELTNRNVQVTSRGGSFMLEEQTNGSHIEVFSGSANLVIYALTGDKKMEAVLVAGQEVTLDETNLKNLFAGTDELQQVLAWNEIVQNSGKRFDGENILISRLIHQLPSFSKETRLEKNLDSIKKYLLFSPNAKENFYWEQIQKALGQTTEGEKTALSTYFAQVKKTDTNIAKATTKNAAAYTRIFLPRDLSPKVKMKVVSLAESGPQLTQFTGMQNTEIETSLMQNLALANIDPTNSQYAKKFKQQILEKPISDTQDLTKQILELIENNKKIADENWLESFQKLNTQLAETKTGLASAINNQLKIAEVLIRSNKSRLGSQALLGLADLLAKGVDKFQPKLLEKIATQGNDLKNRITFLANSHRTDSDTFDEEAYAKWLSEQNFSESVVSSDTANLEKNAEITQPENTLSEELIIDLQPNPTPGTIISNGKVPRPISELEKFLKLLKR